MRLPFLSALSAPRATARRQTRLRLEPLEPRVTPANHKECTIKVAENHILQVYGTEQTDVVQITQNSEGISVACNGHDPQIFKGIKRFWMVGGGGDDVVNAALAPGGLESFWIDLGNGVDTIDVAIIQKAGSPPPITSKMKVDVRGGNGNDDVSIFWFNPLYEPPHTFLFDLQGGAGDDFVSVNAEGSVYGEFAVSVDGANGADLIQCHADLGVKLGGHAQLNLRGGVGTDFFDLDLSDTVNSGRLGLDAQGGLGEDMLMLNAVGLNFAPESDTQIVMRGDGGADHVAARFKFTSEGRFRLDAQGGLGNDLLSIAGAELNFKPGSDTQIVMRGDAGDDQLMHDAYKHTSQGRFLLDALGGLGNDRVSVTGAELNFLPDSSTRIVMRGEAGDDQLDFLGKKIHLQGSFEVSTFGGLGNDVMEGEEEEELIAANGGSTRITMNGEAGDDRINYRGKKIHSEGTFEVSTFGGLGNDAVMIEEEEIQCMPGSSTRIMMNGEAGDDNMGIRLEEVVNAASMRVDVQGGFGRDVASVEGVGLNFLPESQGAFQVRGDAGDDQLSFRIHKHTSEGIFGFSALGGDGNDLLSVDGVGLNFLPESNVQMKISGDAGNDREQFELHEFISLGSLSLDLLGGAGNDALGFDLTSQKVTSALVKVDAGDGADQVDLNFAANIGDFTFTVNAGAGDDLALFRMMSLPPLPGENPGKRMGQFTMDGGAGHDILSADFAADPSAPETDLVASLLGGMGDDKMRLFWSEGFDVQGTADGGVGFDLGLFLPPVKKTNMELLR